MSITRRALMRAGAMTAGLAMFPRPVLAAAAHDRPYGLITLAVSGVTTAVYRIDKRQLRDNATASGYERLGLRRVDSSTTLVASSLQPGADETMIASAVELVARNIASLKSDHDMRDKQIAIVGSSGLRSYVGPAVERLPAMLRERTGIGMRLLTSREEAQLETDWIVPSDDREAVLHVEIGGADIKGGYYGREGRRRVYHDLAVPFGTRNFAGAVKFRYPSVRTDDFGARAADHYREVIAPTIDRRLAALPEALTRPKVYVSGGIAWATAVILHAQDMALEKDWTRLSPDDFTTIRRLIEAGTPYGAGLPDSLTTAQRASIRKTLGFIRNIFNPHQLAAGAAIGAGLAEQLRFAGREAILFPGFANGASSSQYLLYQITNNPEFRPS
ncbi:hypothetical protein SAMN06295920_11259 [Rhizorhabdus histidinilytica]|uniref:Ppx/GppA phosphatase domain-containing protein n=3 Tax=Rhizorhabdus histidinilytica TaxID=439228 RepID=A0A1T5G6A9_9SPHN|nr:hypothetical protein SAMN06295920_11259 [Rhizorhabdus histidinilytica]